MDFISTKYLYIDFEVKWRVTKYRNTQNLVSAFNPSKCIHTVVNTHTHTPVNNTHTHTSEHTHTHTVNSQCCGIEGGENACYSLPPPTIPAGPEIRTHTSGYKSNALSIKPRLPRLYIYNKEYVPFKYCHMLASALFPSFLSRSSNKSWTLALTYFPVPSVLSRTERCTRACKRSCPQ